MALFSRVTTWVSNQVLTASALNGEFNNLLNNAVSSSYIGFSSNVSQMQQQTSPGGIGTESLAGSISDELQRLRFMQARFTGSTYWYDQTVTRNLGTSALAVLTGDIGALAVTAAKIANATITTTQISASAGITSGQLATTPKLNYTTFTSNGTFTSDAGTTKIIIIGCGAGGGGGSCSGGATPGQGGGGGAPGFKVATVTASTGYAITINAGGAGGTGGGNGAVGGTSVVAGLCTFLGGVGGVADNAAIVTGAGVGAQGGLNSAAGGGTAEYTGGAGGAGGAGVGGGGGGAGPYGFGAAGGASNTAGVAAGVNTGAGGGGAGGGGTQNGGAGGSGVITIIWTSF